MAGQHKAGRWMSQVDRNAWALWYEGEPAATDKTPTRTQAEWLERLIDDHADALYAVETLARQLAEELAACAKLAAWAETVKGRAGEVAS